MNFPDLCQGIFLVSILLTFLDISFDVLYNV
jgi:hypothetical protein